MLKVIAAFRFRGDRPREDCLRHWMEIHPGIVKAGFPTALKYVQSRPVGAEKRDWPWDGVSEIWFQDMNAIRMAFADEKATAVRDDDEKFVAHMEWMIVEESEEFRRRRAVKPAE